MNLSALFQVKGFPCLGLGLASVELLQGRKRALVSFISQVLSPTCHLWLCLPSFWLPSAPWLKPGKTDFPSLKLMYLALDVFGHDWYCPCWWVPSDFSLHVSNHDTLDIRELCLGWRQKMLPLNIMPLFVEVYLPCTRSPSGEYFLKQPWVDTPSAVYTWLIHTLDLLLCRRTYSSNVVLCSSATNVFSQHLTHQSNIPPLHPQNPGTIYSLLQVISLKFLSQCVRWDKSPYHPSFGLWCKPLQLSPKWTSP